MAAPIGPGRFDGNLGDILQNVSQIDIFLDVVFEFLYRKTDFYQIMRHPEDHMGLPKGMARNLVMQTYMKYEKEIHSETKDQPVLATEDIAVQEPSIEVVTETTEAKATTEAKEIPKGKEVSQKEKENSKIDDIQKDTSASATEPDHKDSNHRRKYLTPADTYNGALYEDYCWSQSLADVEIKVFVPEVLVKAKQLTIEITNDYLKVKGPSGVIKEGKLAHVIQGDESLWSLHPGKYVQLTIEKKIQTWWRSVFEGEEEIERTKIDSTQNIHDMDDESRADYERVMFDAEQKRQGKPTIKEMETHKILKQAWNAEGSPFKGTEFDPSTVNISG